MTDAFKTESGGEEEERMFVYDNPVRAAHDRVCVNLIDIGTAVDKGGMGGYLGFLREALVLEEIKHSRTTVNPRGLVYQHLVAWTTNLEETSRARLRLRRRDGRDVIWKVSR